MQVVDPLTIQQRSGVKLQYIIFPVEKFFKGVISEGNFERIFKMMLDFLPQGSKIVLQCEIFLLFVLLHIISILKVVIKCRIDGRIIF